MPATRLLSRFAPRRRALTGAGALAALALLVLASGTSAGATTAMAAATGSAPVPSATVSPNVLLGNLQVVTVSWTGLPATSTTVNPMTGYRDNDVAILECTADPPGGVWYYFRDCYTLGENLGGNIVSPSGGIQDTSIPLEGATSPGDGSQPGSGSYPFQVQEGTLQTQEVDFQCGQGYTAPDCNSPYDVQCDQLHRCVLKVVALPEGAPPIPNEVWNGPPTPQQDAQCAKKPKDCTFTQLLDAAPSALLNFGPIPDCPPITGGNLAVEGAASSSYALESWAADLCDGSNPVTVSYSEVGEEQAKSDLLAGNTTVAAAAIPPTSSQDAVSSIPGVLAAPLDAGGVSIVFNMVDPLTGLPIESVRLTPRLVAMLITNSATLNAQEPFGHLAAGSSTRFTEPLTQDPEFKALNPGFQPPAICTTGGDKKNPTTSCSDYVAEPVLRAENNDDTWILTQWIADDYDARQFLEGRDPCGAKLNVDWDQATYPAYRFVEYAKTMSGTTPDSDSYSPEFGTASVLQSMLYGIPVGAPPASEGSPKSWLPVPTYNYAFLGVMDTVSAHRSGLPSAQLIAADPGGSELSRFVSEGPNDTCTPDADPATTGFVSDDQAGLDEAYRIMSTDSAGMLVSPVATTDPDAYPLAKIDYALVPSAGLDTSSAKLAATLVRFAAGPGQTPAYLPPGYVPLPANLEAQALAVAARVALEHPLATAAPSPAPSFPSSMVGSTAVTAEVGRAGTAATTAPAAVYRKRAPQLVSQQSASPVVSVRAPHQPSVLAAAARFFSGAWVIPTAIGLAAASAVAGVGTRGRRHRRRGTPG